MINAREVECQIKFIKNRAKYHELKVKGSKHVLKIEGMGILIELNEKNLKK